MFFRQYSSQRDRWVRSRSRKADGPVTSYGRAEQFIVLDTNFLQHLASFADVPALFLEPVILAIVSPVPKFEKLRDADLVRYKLPGNKLAKPEVIDAKDIDCLIGRVHAPDGYLYIVDRRTVVGRLHTLEGLVQRS